MSEEGISARHTRKWKPKTTKQNPRHQPSPNYLKELSQVDSLGQVWVSDITYVFTRSQTHYLAVVMDLHTRRIVGCALDSHMESSLVLSAIEQAETRSATTAKRMFHSDRDFQYSSHLIRNHLEKQHYQQSMSALGYCYDNAACESFFATPTFFELFEKIRCLIG